MPHIIPYLKQVTSRCSRLFRDLGAIDLAVLSCLIHNWCGLSFRLQTAVVAVIAVFTWFLAEVLAEKSRPARDSLRISHHRLDPFAVASVSLFVFAEKCRKFVSASELLNAPDF